MGFSFLKVVEELLHGAIAGLSIVFISHPIDTLKTRRQVETFLYKDMIRKMIKNEGIMSFYKGVLSPLVSMPLFKAIIYSSYNLCLTSLNDHNIFRDNVNMQVAISGTFSGFITSFICGPTELFKVKMQVQKGMKNRVYTGYWDIFSKIWRVSGYRCIFQGQWATILRDGIGYPINFWMYDYMARYFGNGDKKNATYFHLFIAGMVSGGMSWLPVYPFDVVKSQINSYVLKERVKVFNNFQVWKMLRRIHARDGVKGLYHGFGIYFVRAFPANGLAFAVWSWCQDNIKLERK
jgi:solute carrier family 25 carnitine/acylcarnitine transporter 20/29